MKICPKCQNQVNDDTVFCPNCGNNFAAAESAAVAYAPAPANSFDHTAEFTAKDISDNKVIAMCVYLLGTIGILIALLASKESPYAGFHVRQGLKFTVATTLTAIVTGLLCWTCIVPIAGGILMIALFVVRIICFFNVCAGKAIEPAIIRSVPFFK